jgi:hypothetical protein
MNDPITNDPKLQAIEAAAAAELDRQAAEQAPEETDPQEQLERQMLLGTLEQARAAYAQTKLGYALSKAGVAGVEGHPRQHADNVAKAKKQLEVLQAIFDAGLPMAEPSPLEVASKDLQVPDNVRDIASARSAHPDKGLPGAPTAG